MNSLDHFLDIASEEIEADLARWHPDVDLAELHRHGGLTHRKLWLLLRFLPMESAWKTWARDNIERDPAKPDAVPDYSGQPWSLLNYQIQGLRNDMFALLASPKEGEEIKAPYTVPLGKTVAVQTDSPDRDVISLDEQRARLALVRERRGWSEN